MPSRSPWPHCTVGTCTDDIHAHAMCSMHYARWRKHGDANIALPRGGVRGRPLSSLENAAKRMYPEVFGAREARRRVDEERASQRARRDRAERKLGILTNDEAANPSGASLGSN